MTGYTRTDSTNNIADGNVVQASDLDAEYDAIEAAFNASTGHTHDGTAAEGAPIEVVGPAQDLVVTAAKVEPKTDNTLDLGSSAKEFKDLYLDGTANIDSLVADTADINGGTIDGVTLGTNSAVTEAQVDNINIDGNAITSTDTNGDITISPNGTGTVVIDTDLDVDNININGNAITSTDTNGNIALTPDGTGEVDISKVDIDSGTIDGTTIGGATPAAGTFTTLTANGNVVLGDAATDTVTVTADVASDLIPSADNTHDLGASGSEWKDLYIDGTANIDSLVADTADINGGTIDGVTIGGASAGAGTFTTLQANTSLNVDGTVTADGLTVDDGTNARLTFTGDTSAAKIFATTTGFANYEDLEFRADNYLFKTSTTERMRIDSSGKVGIGESSPDEIIHATTGGNTNLKLETTSSGSVARVIFLNTSRTADIGIETATDAGGGAFPGPASSLNLRTSAADPIVFSTDNTERMRIDSSGNLLVGKTTADGTSVGVEIRPDSIRAARTSNPVAFFNRRTTNGEIVRFLKDGSTVGSIGVDDTVGLSLPYFGSNQFSTTWANAALLPGNGSGSATDNAYDLGASGFRWDDVFATNGTIQTSDRNEKQDIEELSEAEQRVAVAAKSLMRKFRWKSAVEKKGDDARIHFGIIAQDLQAAFEAEGLDAGRYGMFMYNEWWETQTEVPAVEAQDAVYETVTDEEGNETQVLVSEAVEAKEAYTRTDTYETEEEAPEGAVKKSRMGVRYSELLAFIIAAI